MDISSPKREERWAAGGNYGLLGCISWHEAWDEA